MRPSAEARLRASADKQTGEKLQDIHLNQRDLGHLQLTNEQK